MFQDDEQPQKKPRAFVPGQDVSGFSIAEINETIETLKSEIVRLTEARAKKQATAAAADALFRKP
jgi:uncharacterized small protein (DUF1192 family)